MAKEEQKYYTSSGEEYIPSDYHVFRDKDGNTIVSTGKNGYIWESITNGVPVSVNENGDWYVNPYLEVTQDSIVAHMPDWFKSTPEYTEWNERFSGQIEYGINKDTFNQLNDVLNSYGNMGLSRKSFKEAATSYGIVDQDLIDKHAQNIFGLYQEAADEGDYSFTIDGQKYESVAEFARSHKDLSKEELSARLSNAYNNLKKAQENKDSLTREDQEALVDTLSAVQMLGYVNDNYKTFGKDEEFKDLLEASAWQKIVAAEAAWVQTTKDDPFTQTSMWAYGPGAYFLRKYGFNTTLGKVDFSTDVAVGAGLQGTEGYIKVGSTIGSIENVAAAVGASIAAGKAIALLGVSAGAGKLGTFLRTLGSFAQTPVGSMVTDFFLHDTPLDFIRAFGVATADWKENGLQSSEDFKRGVGKAWNDTEQKQNLIQIPIIGNFGPEVDAGLKNDLIGDAIVDLSLPVIGQLAKVFSTQLDTITDGLTTRIREKVALKNLSVQQKLTNIPVLGTGWKKLVNVFMGAQNANFMREMRKASIAEGTMDWYRFGHNVLSVLSTGGAAEVASLYNQLLKKMGIMDDIDSFVKNANKYGGIKEVNVKWFETVGGELKNFYRTVVDTLPHQVKQGLLDIERLSELRGQEIKEGGVITNVARQKEIAALETKVQKLPEKIKKFADKFAELNKRVSELGVMLGITNEEWLKAMQVDPSFEKYMTRQVLTPLQNDRVGSAEAPAQLYGKRKGYYAENYIDPFQALNLKVAAMGRAYAWHQQAKTLAGAQIAQGNIIAGKGGVETAEKLKEVKNKIAGVESVRKAVDYDGVVKKIGDDSTAIIKSINEVNDLLNAPQQISLKSIYTAGSSPAIAEFVADFDAGKYKFADGVRAAANLSDADAALMIHNTYSHVTTAADGSKTLHFDTSQASNSKYVNPGEHLYNSGVAPDGRAFRYTIEGDTITNIKLIDDAPGMAETIQRLGGVHNIDVATVEKIGPINARAINRTIMFYRDNMPNLRDGSTFRCQMPSRSGVRGWVPNYGSTQYGYKLENGRLVPGQFPVYLSEVTYSKGMEERALASFRNSIASRWSPKNTDDLAYVPVHENGHATMARLCVYRVNEKLDNGTLKIPDGTDDYKLMWVRNKVDEEETLLNAELTKKALDACGISYNGNTFKQVWRQTAKDQISRYAGDYDGKTPTYQWETFSEAVADVWANDEAASKFSLAIVEAMREEANRFAMAANPKSAMIQNGITFPKNLFKGDHYNFPDGVKTNAQKAAWLAKKRKENPFIGGNELFTEEQYKLANKWDTFFKSEIESYDPSCKTSSPNKLIAKNGDFVEDLNKNIAKKLVDKVREASVEGFDQNLATLVLGKSRGDVAEALDNFVIDRIERGARKIAEKMPGGLTEENLNTARITLYQDSTVKADMTRTLSSMASELSLEDVSKKVNTLFDDQAKGLASVEALGVDYGDLEREQTRLRTELAKSNNYARAIGKKADEALWEEGFSKNTTKVIHYVDGGEDVYVVVKDPVIASILKNPDNFKEHGSTAEGLFQAANTIARMYRLGTTGVNPLAFVRNVLRDPVQAWVSAGTNPLVANLSPEAFYHSLRKYGLDDATIAKVDTKLRNWASTGTMTSALRQMGGDTPGTVGYMNKAEKFTKQFNNGKGGKIISFLEQPMEMWESTFRNQVAQQSFTKAMRRTGGDVDKSLASAMFDASNATTNFSYSIGKFRRAAATIPYMSGAINGVGSFARMFNSDPLGVTCRISAGFMVPVMVITAWNLSSEERRKAYMNLPEWYRDGHLVLVDLEGNIFAVPIPEEVDQFYGTARRIIEYTHEANAYTLPQIMAQGALGFAPVDIDGYFNEDGTMDPFRGTMQMASGLIPQAVTLGYEWFAQEKMYTGQDISNYDAWNRILNAAGNVFGTSFTNVVNDIGFMCGASSSQLVGKTTIETLSRDLFGMGFDNAKQQFMNMVGSETTVDPQTHKVKKATGLFAEAERIQGELKALDQKIAFAETEEEKEEYEKQKQQKVEDFGKKVAAMTNKYMQLYTIGGGIEDWQRSKLIKLLQLGETLSSASAGSYQAAEANQLSIDNWSIGRQRYVDLGLPSGPTPESLTMRQNGNLQGSIELQAAINRYYGAPKQAAQDYKNAIEEAGLKDIKNEFYDAIEKIYDTAEAQGIDPDYDMIERIQARYLQAVDAVMVPIINQYGISILNNNDFINEVRSELGGMIPSDDWKQSIRNPKKFLSKKDYPLAAVDVKKWLQDRYESGMRNRGLDSDQVVKDRISNVEGMIDRGERGKAKGEIESIMNGVDKANFYISSTDYQRLLELYNMVK